MGVLAGGPPTYSTEGFPWLTVITFAPLVGAAVSAVVPGRAVTMHRVVALAATLITFVLSLGMLGAFQSGPGFQLVDQVQWIRPLDVNYTLGVDGISLWMVLLTTFLMPAAILASWRVEHQVKYFMLSFLILETAMLGSFLALDLLLFFLFFEALLFPMYLIIGTWGSERRVYAAVKFFLFTMAGSAFLLVAILFLYFTTASQAGGSFDITVLQNHEIPVTTARWLFLAFFVAFAVKVPLFPLHTWLPDAHTEAPTAGSLILAAVLLKVGAYGLIRFNLSLFPEASEYFKDFISILALIGIVYGAVVALIQTDVKRLVAYSSVSHLGFVVLGTFAFTLQGLSGGVLQMVNHGLSTGALFLLVGMLYERVHTRELTRMGGLGVTVPVLAGLFLFVALSSIGLPGLNGFVGEFLILVGTFTVNKTYAVIAVTGVVLAAIYLLWAYQRAFHGAPAIAGGAGGEGGAAAGGEGKGARLVDLSLREHLVLAPIVAAILAIGLYPNALLKKIEPSTAQLGACVSEQQTGSRQTTVLGCVPVGLPAGPGGP